MLKATYKTVKVQGLSCYVPVIKCYENERLIWKRDVHPQYPLVSKRDAIKYAHIEINDLNTRNITA
jgi:hypothetical protein